MHRTTCPVQAPAAEQRQGNCGSPTCFLIEAVHVINRYGGVAGGDAAEKLLHYTRGKISHRT